jgi:hypothetical protein
MGSVTFSPKCQPVGHARRDGATHGLPGDAEHPSHLDGIATSGAKI